jgi:hypothetical protein
VDRRIGILDFGENCLVLKEKLSVKLLTFKFNKMTSIFANFSLLLLGKSYVETA